MHIGHTPTVENGLLGTESGHEIRELTSHEANTHNTLQFVCAMKKKHIFMDILKYKFI